MTTFRRVEWVIVLVALLAACGGSSGGSATTPTTTGAGGPSTTAPAVDGLVDVGGRRLHVVCQGDGSPAVVIEMGAGQRVSAWNGTQAELAASHRTCVYERAGIGTSEPGPAPRTAQEVADDLQALVDAGAVPAPMVIVSHSLGGMFAELFAAEHGDEIAGLVFVDPRTAEYQLGYRANLTPEEVQADADDIASTASEPFGPEVAGADDSAREVVAAGGLPDVPVIVLTAGVPFPDQSAADVAFWRLTHQHLADEVPGGQERIVEGAEHEIWRTNSEEVVDAVAEVTGAG